MAKIRELTGQKFNRLLVIKYSHSRKHRSWWLCKCDCGNQVVVNSNKLTTGHTLSCGCAKSKHGFFNTKVYRVWNGMRQRCHNQNDAAYYAYGGRGIKVCAEWKNNSGEFCRWAMLNGWKDGLQIDRKNNNGNYEPGNCRFVTGKINMRNSRNAKVNQSQVDKIRILAPTINTADLSKKYGVSTGTIRSIVRYITWQP